MPFIPHTIDDIQTMLHAIGCEHDEDIFSDIPNSIPRCSLDTVRNGCSEQDISREIYHLAQKDNGYVNYIGAGAYDHYTPKAVWSLVSRGEFYSSYTPYQAEASQGILQVFYEFQSFIARLTAMPVVNASLYDASTGLAEAILMVKRIRGLSQKERVNILLPHALSPRIQETLSTLLHVQNCHFEYLPTHTDGLISTEALKEQQPDHAHAIVIAFPNYFGCLEDIHSITDLAHQQGLLVIALVNPLSLALFSPPGEWGENGADIVVGDVQPLGIPLSSGGPFAGFMATKTIYMRQIPGRLVGKTRDKNDRSCFTLTLQAREQHIRREKSTSNICTNQGLLVIAATIYMALMGESGLRRIALYCHNAMQYFLGQITTIPGVNQRYKAPFFHEIVLTFDKPINALLEQLQQKNKIIGGLPINQTVENRGNHDLLICITETKTQEDIDRLVSAIRVFMEG